MKEFLHNFLFSIAIILASVAIVIASVVIGISINRSAKMISDGLKTKELTTSEKILSELESLKNSINKIDENVARLKEQTPVQNQPSMPLGSKRVEGVTAGTNPIKGDTKAKVLMVEFGNFQCGFCVKFYKEIFPKIETEYISTGKVKFAHRDFPFSSNQLAKGAAIACICAGEQGKYWQMFDEFLQGNSIEKNAIGKYAQELGIDLKAFNECLDKPQLNEAVENDIKDGTKFGVTGTPSFFINGRFVVGTQAFEEFKRIIEEELKK